MSEIEIDGAKTVDKKAICNDFVPLNLLRKWAKILMILFLSISISWAWVLKAAKYAICTQLQFIFNQFIQNSVIPTVRKHAYVTPIHKKRSTTQVCNYRPFSVTPTFAKFFEKLLLFQMMDHINKNNLLNREHFGFQNKKFSTDAVLFFTETVIKNHENGQNTAAIFLDLAKAFNSIWHKLFLKKAECFNFSEPAVTLLRSFLEERWQCVKIGTEVSEHIFVDHGVQQGTVLGPLIFLLYVNDFSEKNRSWLLACSICKRY